MSSDDQFDPGAPVRGYSSDTDAYLRLWRVPKAERERWRAWLERERDDG